MSWLLFYISVSYSVLIITLVDCLTVQRYYFSSTFSISFTSASFMGSSQSHQRRAVSTAYNL